MREVKWLGPVVVLAVLRGIAWGGWEIEQSNYNLRASGKEIGRSSSTMRISKNRVRISDGLSVTIFDYEQNRLAMLLPPKRIYWSGTIDEYLVEAVKLNPKRRVKPGELKHVPQAQIVVKETPVTAEIAGKPTKKYAVTVDGRAFQDVWLAPDFGIDKDLDAERYRALQKKMNQSVRSSYGAYQAQLADNPTYAQIIRGAFPLRTNTYLGEAIFGTEVVRVTQTDLPDSDFAVPADFKHVDLGDLLETQQAMNDARAAELMKEVAKAKPKTPKPKAGKGKMENDPKK